MKPFLKWAGNKYRIIQHIQEALPKGGRLIEPFAGSGAVFLNTHFEEYLVNDFNPDLIHLYQYLKDEKDSFIDYASGFFTDENNTAERFYENRQLFNTTDDTRLKSALFLYLNRHGFNGLCRYNLKGQFNVPYGKYKKPYFPQKELEFFSEKVQFAELTTGDFEMAMRQAKSGDVIYCDPPYVPLSETADFTSYSAGVFGRAEQDRLADCAKELSVQGIPVIISNHLTPYTKKTYTGAKIVSFDVQRFISCKGDNRQKASELLAVFGT